MSWSTSRGTHSAYFSVSPKLLYSKNTDQVEIDPLFAAAINVTDNQQVMPIYFDVGVLCFDVDVLIT